MSRRQWRGSGIEQGRYCCHGAELHAHHGSNGVHIVQGASMVHFALQIGAHTRRAAFEGVVANVNRIAKSWPVGTTMANNIDQPMWMDTIILQFSNNGLDPRGRLGAGITCYVPGAAMCRQAQQACTQHCCLGQTHRPHHVDIRLPQLSLAYNTWVAVWPGDQSPTPPQKPGLEPSGLRSCKNKL